MNLIYAALAMALVTAVMQANLDKAGVGRIEATQPTALSNLRVMLAIPLTLLSNLGVLVVTVWSFLVLPWLPTLGVVAAAFVVFSLVWGFFVATIRRSDSWPAFVAIGIPLVFALRILCAASVVFLIVRYVQGGAL